MSSTATISQNGKYAMVRANYTSPQTLRHSRLPAVLEGEVENPEIKRATISGVAYGIP